MDMKLDTLLAQAGNHSDTRTGALSTPIFQSATFSHPALGKSTGFDYSRSANPTRSVLEQTLATLDTVPYAFAFGSGLAALDAVFRLLQDNPNKKILVTEDPYGGTVRLLEQFFHPIGITPVYVDTSNTKSVVNELKKGGFSMVLIEIPTNPLLRVAEVSKIAKAAHDAGALLVIDNTFLTPYLFKPFEHDADIAVYSATKYLCGHNDVVAGAITCKNDELGARLKYIQNATGAILGPLDSWLLLRGLKTLAIRLERQEKNALQIAKFLEKHPYVTKIRYPGLKSDPGHARLKKQALGFGAMLSFEIDHKDRVEKILNHVKIFSFAESLGGVESLITYPLRQTHADVPENTRNRLGINDRLLRLSIGIEDIDDLIRDLQQAMK